MKLLLDQIIESTAQRLQNEAPYLLSYTKHPAEKGRLLEAAVTNALREFLPPKMGLGTGFIQSPDKQSRQQDIIVYDTIHNMPLYQSNVWNIYPIEMVYASIEVKAKLTKKNLLQSLKACSGIRGMMPGEYLIPNPSSKTVQFLVAQNTTPPRFFIFAYDCEWTKFDTFKKSVEAVSKAVPKSHIHGICILKRGWFGAQKAFNSKNEFSFSQHGLKLFLNTVHLTCDGSPMMPLNRSRYMSK